MEYTNRRLNPFILFYGIIAFFLSSNAYAYDPRKPLTKTERQELMNSFNQFEIDDETKKVTKKAIQCDKSSSPEIQCTNIERKPFRSRWAVNGTFMIEITYLNDKNYPVMYAGSEQYQRFEVNSSLVFKEQMTELILSDYLDTDYEQYSPKLLAVSETTTAIKLLVKNSGQLQALLDDPRVTDVRHIGDNIRDVLVVPKY